MNESAFLACKHSEKTGLPIICFLVMTGHFCSPRMACRPQSFGISEALRFERVPYQATSLSSRKKEVQTHITSSLSVSIISIWGLIILGHCRVFYCAPASVHWVPVTTPPNISPCPMGGNIASGRELLFYQSEPLRQPTERSKRPRGRGATFLPMDMTLELYTALPLTHH